MKFILLLLPLLAFSKTKNIDLSLLADDLNIKVSSSGKCLYTRNQVNSAQLFNRFGTPLKESSLELENELLKPYWNCIYLRRNLKRDNKSFFITNENVEKSLEQQSGKTISVSGKIRYVGIINKKYRYDLSHKNGVTTATVKVHFNTEKLVNDSIESSLDQMDLLISEAEDNWNAMAPQNYRFKFIQVRKKEDSFFSVKLLSKDTSGPYDSKWSLQWSAKVVTHEFGHMMGLDDEYDQITTTLLFDINRLLIKKSNLEHLPTFSDKYNYGRIKALRCDMTSIMCNHYQGKLNDWHMYIIFKRFFQ